MITGSFFDIVHINPFDAAYWSDRCRFWKDENWQALFDDMHGIGMDTAICIATANWGRPLFSPKHKDLGLQIEMACEDPLEICFDRAEKLGMKMFLGLGYRGRCSQVRDYARMEKPWPDIWFEWNTLLAEELMLQYGGRKGFGGFYIAYEIDFNDGDAPLELYEKWLGEYLRPAIGKDVKLLASPGSLANHYDISKLPSQLERTTIDILAPQDYGGRSNDIAEALRLVQANADAMEKISPQLDSAGIELWCNCELFATEPSLEGRIYCVPGPIERIKKQIEIAAQVAGKTICYQYQGIMNRRSESVNIGREDCDALYKEYCGLLK
jgi:hypothetical protein